MAHEFHLADYREWCAHCAAGKGVSHKHSTSDRESRSDTSEFCLDYAFMTEEGGIRYLEDICQEDDAGLSPVLVSHNRTSEALWAMVAEAQRAPVCACGCSGGSCGCPSFPKRTHRYVARPVLLSVIVCLRSSSNCVVFGC